MSRRPHPEPVPVYPDTPGRFVELPDGSIVPEADALSAPPQLPPASEESNS